MATKTKAVGSSTNTNGGSKAVAIKAPAFQVAEFHIRGTSPYVQNKFSKKAEDEIRATQAAGSQAKSKKVREPKDFDQACKNATYCSTEGWLGIPAPAFRDGMISACRTVGFKMTHAKLAAWVIADGFDAQSGKPLVKIQGEPERYDAYVRNDNGSIDIRSRPMWKEWSAVVRVKFDADMLSVTDVANLLMRVGYQVGIGEGRNASKDSSGMGWGSFEIVNNGVVS